MLATSEIGTGGPDRVVRTLARGLSERGHHVVLFVGSLDGAVDVPDVDVRDGGGARYPVRALARTTRRSRPSALLATHRMVETVGLAAPALPRGLRVVLRPANNPEHAIRALDEVRLKHRVAGLVSRRALGRADVVVAQSPAMATSLAATTPGVDGRLVTIGNPTDTAAIRAAAGPPADRPSGGPHLVTVGRLERQKGMDRVLEAFIALRRVAPQAELTFVGDGGERSDLEQRAAAARLGESVRFAGTVANPFPLVASADLYVSGARWEGLPNALIEAQAIGLPAVAWGGPAAGDAVIDDGVTGRVVDDQRAFEAAIIEVATGHVLGRDVIAAATDARFGLGPLLDRYEATLLS